MELEVEVLGQAFSMTQTIYVWNNLKFWKKIFLDGHLVYTKIYYCFTKLKSALNSASASNESLLSSSLDLGLESVNVLKQLDWV